MTEDSNIEEQGLLSEEERQEASDKMREETERKQKFGDRDDAYFEGKHIYLDVDLPSGGVWDDNGQHRVVKLREMTSEFDEILSLAAREENVTQEHLHQILVGCIERFGNYEKKSDIRRSVNKMIHNDYLYLFMKLRQLSVSDEFRFRSQCENDDCRAVNDYKVYLSELAYDVPEDTSPEGRHHVDVFERIEGIEWEIHWHCMTVGELDEFRDKIQDSTVSKKFANIKSSKSSMDMGLLAASMIPRIDKIVEPDGTEWQINHTVPHVDKDGVLGIKGALDYIQDLPWRIRDDFTNDVLDEKEPGVDDSVYLTCSSCGSDVVKSIKVFSGNFFMPSR